MELLLNSALGLTLVQFILYLPAELVVIGASFYLFDIRKKGLFAAVTFALFVANTFAVGYIPSWLGAILGVFVLVGPQLAFSCDSLARKVFTAVVMQIAIVIAEVPPSMYWIGITDVSPTSAVALTEYFEYLLFARVIHVASLVVLLAGEHRAQRTITGHRTDRGALIFVWMLVLQYVMVALGVYTIEIGQAFSEAAAIGLSAICAICLVADVGCFALLDYYNRRERDLWRMAFLQGELDRYLSAYEGIERELAGLAQVRHDLRNHMSVVMYLVEKKDLHAAAAHVREMIEGLDRIAALTAFAESDDPPVRDFAAKEEASEQSDDAYPILRRLAISPEAEVKSRSNPAAYSSLRRWAVAVFPLSQIATAAFLFGYAAATALPAWFYVADVIVCTLCFIADVVLFHYLSLAFKQGDVEMKTQLLADQAQVQREYYDRLSLELEEALASRNDLLQALIDLEERLLHGDSADVSEIFDSVILAPIFKEGRFCQNRVVNALVSIKAAACVENDIRFDCAVSVPGDTPISTVDLCALFSNLLDNALRSCRQIDEGERFISLRAGQVAGVFAVTMENSCVVSDAVDDSRDGRAIKDASAWDLVSVVGVSGVQGSSRAKRDRLAESIVREHGWGLRILRDMAGRYQGTFEASFDGQDRFQTSIMLVLDSAKR